MAHLVHLNTHEELKKDVMKPLQRYGHVAVRYHRCIAMFGGASEAAKPSTGELFRYRQYSMRVIWLYDLDIDRWIKFVVPDTQNIPSPSFGSCAVDIGSHLYTYGGLYDDGRLSDGIGDLWKLSRSADGNFSWTQLTTEVRIAPRCGHSGWEYENKLWIFGGMSHNIFEYLHDNETFLGGEPYGTLRFNNQLCCFSPTEQKWMTVKSKGTKPSPRWFHGITKLRDNVWLYGGSFGAARYCDLYELQLRTLTWTQVHIPGPRDISPAFIAV